MDLPQTPQKRWIDIIIKILPQIVTGLLIAWAGFISNYYLSSISSAQESARLITELQIRREQAESELRKDVFDQTLQAFLLKNLKQDYSIKGMSKQLLRLELLALNFGDSLSLSPLFNEFRRDLNLLNIDDNNISADTNRGNTEIFHSQIGKLRKRLNSLARRVASNQVSSLQQHGISKIIRIPLTTYNNKNVLPCGELFYEKSFTWPTITLQQQIGIYDDKFVKKMKKDEIKNLFATADAKSTYKEEIDKARIIKLLGTNRYLEIIISNVDLCNKSARISIILYKEQAKKELIHNTDSSADDEWFGLSDVANKGLEIEIQRSFKLDYYNFPKVDNTRLENNQRFAIVLDEFNLKSANPHLLLIGMIFPSEYASLRDRSGMREALKLLRSALKADQKEETGELL